MYTIPYITNGRLNKSAIDFLSGLPSNYLGKSTDISIPIDIEYVVDKLGFKIRFIETHDYSFKGCLFLKTKEIGVANSFQQERYNNIYRYTLAHELAHYVLHKDFYEKHTVRTYEEWCVIYCDNADDISRAERQADIWASYFLLPQFLLEKDVEFFSRRFQSYGKDDRSERIVEAIAKKYMVSLETARIRLSQIESCVKNSR